MLPIAVGLLLLVDGAAGQSTAWELSPYQMEVILQLRPSPRLPSALGQRLADDLAQRIDTLWGSALRVHWRLAPSEDQTVGRAMAAADAEQAVSQQGDVAMVVVISDLGSGYRIEARQQSLVTFQWGPLVRLEQPSARGIAGALLHAISQAFVPVVEIQRVDDHTVVAQARAAQLLPEHPGPLAIEAGTFLQPIVGQVQRTGEMDPRGVRPIDWTILQVEEANAEALNCRLYSAYRQPLRSQRSARVGQWAHPIRQTGTQTTLRMTNRQDPPQPLMNYQVFAWSLDQQQPLGQQRSDWQGEILLDAETSPAAQLLLIKHGDRLLARLPVVIGAHEQLTVTLNEDPALIAADAFVHSVQQDLLDLMVRRQLMGLRIRRLLESGRTDMAQEVLQDLRRLDSQSDFLSRMQSQQRQLATDNPAVQSRIDKLFADTRQLLSSVLDPGFVQELQTAVSQHAGGT